MGQVMKILTKNRSSNKGGWGYEEGSDREEGIKEGNQTVCVQNDGI